MSCHELPAAIDELLEISKVVNGFHESFNAAMLFDLEKFYPDLFAKYKENKVKAVHTFISNNLSKGIEEGIYRNDLDINLIAGLYLKKMDNVRDADFFKDFTLSFEHVFEVMFENHIRGIANEKGIAYFECIKDKYKNQTIS